MASVVLAPRLAAALFAAGVLSGPVAAAGIDGPARALVRSSLAEMAAGRDPHAATTLKSHVRQVRFDIVENDHPGPPYYHQSSEADVFDDIVGRRQDVTFAPPSREGALVQTPDMAVTVSHYRGAPQRMATRAAPSWETQNPLRALLLAERAPDLALEPDVTLHAATQHVVSFHNGRYRVRLLIDASSGLLSATEALVAFDRATSIDLAWGGWGDVVERTEYMNWNVTDGVRYPYQWDLFRNGELMTSSTINELQVDPPHPPAAIDLAPTDVPDPTTLDDVPLGHPIALSPNPNRPIEEIAPGVVQIPGSWYATLVRQPDGVVIIDAPISAGYSARVLAEAERRFPGVPIKAVITSTGFFWHVAGVREYAARGIPIYAEARNAPMIRRMLAARHTLIPDDLSKGGGKAPVVRAITQPTAIGSGPNALVVSPIRRATQPMLMTYLKDARLLHTAEMVQPLGKDGALLFPESLIEISREVREDGLSVDRIIGMHMSPTPWSTVADAIRAAGAAS